ncbi:reductive dehalogenase [Oceanirhabdus sp. W0125-5]|uniref:reductive dehalogenase n=1 Tax=Oceanirhabdus sp. W0125-5 TaxID=2999116 RepID=UPI0022F33161|nr:reductive dehalogenase [Oceanirhabdus sp. W0125-5]WBW97237.1 reductive dehalogenase [Oceanirhabdus sp. W0125-5]
MNRREFIKATGVAGVSTAIAGATMASNPKKVMAVELAKEQDDFPAEVTKDFKGFSFQNCMFIRGFWDNEPFEDEYIKKTYSKEFHTLPAGLVNYFGIQSRVLKGRTHDPNKVGYREVEIALGIAGASMDKHFGGGSKLGAVNSPIQTFPINPMTGEKMSDTPVFVQGLYSWDNSTVDKRLMKNKSPYEFKDSKDAAKYVKKAAKFLGADLVGIAPYNERTKRWTYTEWATPKTELFTMPDGSKEYLFFNPIKLQKGEYETFGANIEKSDIVKKAGFEPKSIIVMAFEMDYEAFKAAPSYVANTTVQLSYSNMAEVTHKVATFLRELGYKAIPCGNDTSLSVPLAIEAGLGEGSRMGMVVTEKYGPRVRLAKVYTDLEIHPDKPKTFGVREFCNVCMKCADACPGKAISSEPSKVLKEGMEFDTGKVSISNITEVEKWFCSGERCFSYWNYNEAGCSTCIAVCPYNKIDEWHHDLSKLMTLTPFKSLLRNLDEWFGYGGPVDPEERIESKYLIDAVNDFWNKL